MKKNLVPKFGPNEPKSSSKLVFLPLSQAWFVSFPWNYNDNLHAVINCNKCLTSIRGKIYKKNWGPKFLPKLGAKLHFLPIFEVQLLVR